MKKVQMIKKIKNWIKSLKKSNSPFSEMRLVFSTTELHLATLNKLHLEEEGIPVFIIDKRDSSYNAFGEIELYVHQNFILRAKHLINKSNE